MTTYRVSVRKPPAAERYSHFGRWFQAWRFARAMRACGFVVRTERVR